MNRSVYHPIENDIYKRLTVDSAATIFQFWNLVAVSKINTIIRFNSIFYLQRQFTTEAVSWHLTYRAEINRRDHNIPTWASTMQHWQGIQYCAKVKTILWTNSFNQHEYVVDKWRSSDISRCIQCKGCQNILYIKSVYPKCKLKDTNRKYNTYEVCIKISFSSTICLVSTNSWGIRLLSS